MAVATPKKETEVKAAGVEAERPKTTIKAAVEGPKANGPK